MPNVEAAALRLDADDHHARYVDLTRRRIYPRLGALPEGAVLREYFDRGKMLRARLVFAASDAVGGHVEHVLIAAEAVELLHAASLFHDDIIDAAAQRRGLTSLHERLGVGPALVLGDELLFRAIGVICEARLHHANEIVLQAVDALNHFAQECCHAQLRELSADASASEEDYISIVAGKTGAPFAAAGVLGVLLGGGTAAQLASIRVYARNLGVAFQIADDLLDLMGDPVVLGKPVGNSLAHQRPLLPLIYLRERGTAAVHTKLRRLQTQEWPRAQLLALLEEQGIPAQVRATQRRFLTAALAALADFDGTPAVATLHQITELVGSACDLPSGLPASGGADD